MSTYVIGDVQGCYEQLRRLLDQIAFDPLHDTLWFVGDLVNRGPQSRDVVRFVKSLGENAITVLGNHDLALLVVAEGIHRAHAGDTFDDILTAPDRDELLDWLRHRKLLHAAGNDVMVHAGLLPQWTVRQASALAREVEAILGGDGYRDFLAHMYGNEPARWDDDLSGYDRLRVVVNAMTRLRLIAADGTMEFRHKLGPAHGPAGCLPWYDVSGRASCGARIVFGHWAALGLLVRDDVVCLDSGCVWGRALSALRLENRHITQCGCAELVGKTAGD